MTADTLTPTAPTVTAKPLDPLDRAILSALDAADDDRVRDWLAALLTDEDEVRGSETLRGGT